jgi:hypothetical protein
MRGPLAHLLRNRFYIGEVAFKGENLPGEQPAIVDRQLFDAVKLTQQVNLIRKPDQRGDAIVCGLSERFSCQSRQPKRRAGADGLMSSGGRKFLRASWQRTSRSRFRFNPLDPDAPPFCQSHREILCDCSRLKSLA